MHAAVWLVQVPGTPRCYVFLQGGYGGRGVEIGCITHREQYCIVYPDTRDETAWVEAHMGW